MYEKFYKLSPMYKKFENIESAYETMLPQDERVSDRLEMNDMGLANQSFYLRTWGGFPVYQNTDISYFHETDKLLQDMEKNLQEAQKFIFLECHVCEDSIIWKGLMEIIRERAAAGVEVRILYDGTGSKARDHVKFIERMKNKKIQCKVFHSRKGIAKMDYRDYRKTLVIDGKFAYTGDYEFTNEQFHLDKDKPRWQVAGIRLTGDGVRSLTLTYLRMWNVTEKDPEDPIPYLLKTAYRAGDSGFVQPFTTNPMKSELVGKNAYLNLIRNARSYIYLTLPENVINTDMKQELLNAAKRGVHVYLILQDKKGKKVQKPSWEVTGLIRFFYYKEGLLNMHLVVSDDQAAIVGNIHSNKAAIHHMFENGCWFALCRTVLAVKTSFEQLLPDCIESI